MDALFCCLLASEWGWENRFWKYDLRPLEHCFRDVQGKEIPFTPMQHQLMELFMASGDMKLSKITICESLWPKKPDASETLYTLIRRLKPVVSEHCGLTITAEKGGGYRLKHL